MAYLRHTVILTFFLLTLSMSQAFAATCTWNAGSAGNWSDPSNWTNCGGVAPQAADTVVFDGTSVENCTINTDITVAHLQLNSGYTGVVSQGTSNITVDGAYTQAAGTFTGGSGNFLLGTYWAAWDRFTLSGGTFTAPSGTFTIAYGSWAHYAGGTFAHNNGTVAFTDSFYLLNLANTATETFYNLTVNLGADGNYVRLFVSGGSATIQVSNLLLLQNGTLYAASGGWTSTGSLTVKSTFDGGDVDFSNANLSFTGDASNLTIESGATLPQFTYNPSAGSFTLPGTATFMNTLTLSARDFNMGSGNISVKNITLSGSTVTSTSGTLTITENFTHTGGTFDANGGTVTIGGAGGATFNNASEITFNHLNITKSNWATTIADGDTFTVAGNLSLTGAGGLVFANMSTCVLNAKGHVTVGAGFGSNWTTRDSRITFTGTGNQTFTLTGATGDYDGDIVINKASGTVSLASALVMNSDNQDQDLTITSGTLSLAGNDLTVNGSSSTMTVANGGVLQLQGGENITANTGYPTFASGSTVKYVGTATGGSPDYTIKNYSYSNLTIAGGNSSLFAQGANTTVAGTLTLTSGIYDIAGYNLIGGGTIDNDSASTGNTRFRLRGGETITMTKDTDTGLVEYTGTSTYATLPYGNSYNNLTFNGSGGSFTHDNTLDINGNLTITAGTLNSNGQNITLAGNWSNSGTYTSGANTVTFDGSGAQSLVSGGNSGDGYDFNNLTVNKAGGTLTLSSNDVEIDGNFTLTAGTLDANARTMTVRGNWDNNDSFLANGSTVNLGTASQTISGSTSFHNLTKQVSSAATLTLTAGTTQTVTNTLTLNGASGQLLTIASSTTSAAIFNAATSTVSHLSVSYNNNMDDSPIACWIGCTNGGNNTNWSFSAPTVTLSRDNATIAENGGTAAITATLSAASPYNTVINLSYSGTATNVSDYTRSGTSITIIAGTTTNTATLTGVHDTLDEDDETIITSISSVDNSYATDTGATPTVTITDDDAAPSVAWTASSQSSADETNGATMTVTAQLSAASGRNISIPFTVTGTATGSGTDYSITASPLTINAGGTTVSATITLVGDTLDEDNETVILTIGSPTNASQGATLIHTATITDDDAEPTVAWTSSSQSTAETNGATLTVTAQLSAVSAKNISVPFTVTGTATGAGTDYTITSSPISINAGSTTATATVTIVGDNYDEADETMILTIDSPTNASQGATLVHTATITDDDATPTLTLTSVTVGEADSSATVTVSMTNYSGSSVTVDYATSNGTATAGSDYTTASGTLTWTSGQTGNKTFNVSITDDSIHEDNETVALAISNVAHATLSVSAATLTITDNDASSSGGSSGSGDGSGGASGGGGGSGGSSGSSGSSGSGGESETGGSSGSSDSGEDSPLSVQASHVDTGLVYETHGGEGILLATSDDADISTEGVQYTVDSVTVTIPAGSGTTRDIVVTSEPASDDEDIIFSSPYASSGAGLAVIIPRTSLIEDASFLDMEVAPSVSALTVPILRSESVSGSTVLYGRQAGDHFGAYVASGDVNGDGSIEYLFAAPGEGLYGEIHIFNQDLVEVATIFGSADQPIRSILVAQMMGASTADINFGPGNRALNSDLVNVSALELSEYSSRITSLEGSSNVEGSLDLSEIDTNAVVGAGNTYQSFTTGDVNGDNTNDLIVSTSNSIAIFLGPITPATSVSYTNASHIITGDGGSFGQSLATADINHDGIDDLLIGAPDYDPHGAIYVLFGRYFWDTDSITNQISLGLASQVTGSTGRIGSDMLIRSADAAAFTLYTPETATSTLTLTLTSDVVIDQSNEVHVAGNESALGCTLLLREEGGARDRSTSVMIGILLLAMIALRSQVLLGKNRILQRRPRVEVDRL